MHTLRFPSKENVVEESRLVEQMRIALEDKLSFIKHLLCIPNAYEICI